MLLLNEVADCLGNERKVMRRRGRPSTNVDLAEKRLRGPTTPVFAPAVHQDKTGHWPIWVEKKGPRRKKP